MGLQMGSDVRGKSATRRITLQSRTDEIESSRHVLVSSERGVVTEMDRLTTDEYVVRYLKSSADAGVVSDVGSWIGFRYRDAHWSFVKQ